MVPLACQCSPPKAACSLRSERRFLRKVLSGALGKGMPLKHWQASGTVGATGKALLCQCSDERRLARIRVRSIVQFQALYRGPTRFDCHFNLQGISRLDDPIRRCNLNGLPTWALARLRLASGTRRDPPVSITLAIPSPLIARSPPQLVFGPRTRDPAPGGLGWSIARRRWGFPPAVTPA